MFQGRKPTNKAGLLLSSSRTNQRCDEALDESKSTKWFVFTWVPSAQRKLWGKTNHQNRNGVLKNALENAESQYQRKRDIKPGDQWRGVEFFGNILQSTQKSWNKTVYCSDLYHDLVLFRQKIIVLKCVMNNIVMIANFPKLHWISLLIHQEFSNES